MCFLDFSGILGPPAPGIAADQLKILVHIVGSSVQEWVDRGFFRGKIITFNHYRADDKVILYIKTDKEKFLFWRGESVNNYVNEDQALWLLHIWFLREGIISALNNYSQLDFPQPHTLPPTE